MVFERALAPWYTSNIIKEKIAKLQLDWAPKSLDLNSVEMLWLVLDKKVGYKTNLLKSGTH